MQINQGALVGKRLGKYELLALLAIGGTAEIYLARIGGEAGFEKYVVVKCLLDHLADETEYVKMFLDEARLGAQLDHSNIVQTLELGENEGRYFMAMEYLSGMSLAQLARKTNQRVVGGRLPAELVLGMAAQACAGLHYAHRKQTASGKPLNLVHRDISPQNLVVSFEGLLKIVDFGIAKADVRDTHTRSGTIKGKFAYMSPEQCLAKTVDHRTDIFALGVIMHELLTARRLFKRTTTYETYEAIIKGKVPKPSEVAPEIGTAFDDVVMRALQYRKEDRWESAEMLGQAILSTLHKRGTSVNASDIAAFYDEHFEAELKEHADRMRMLITGKKESVVGDESVNWGSDEVEGAEAEEESEIAIDIEGSMVESVESLEMEMVSGELTAPPTLQSLDELGVDESRDTLPPSEPVGATRVEANPMALLESEMAPRSTTIDVPQSTSVDTLDRTQIQADTTTPNPKPAGPGGKTIAPGGGAPMPRAEQSLPRASQALPRASEALGGEASSAPSAKTIGPGQMMAAKHAGPSAKTMAPGQKTPAGSAPSSAKTIGPGNLGAPKPPERRPRQTAGPSEKTIAPGQLSISPPSVPDRAAKGRSRKPSTERPTVNLNVGTTPPPEVVADEPKPRMTVMGVSAESPVSPRPRASTTSARDLYQAPPPKDPMPPAGPPAGTPPRPSSSGAPPRPGVSGAPPRPGAGGAPPRPGLSSAPPQRQATATPMPGPIPGPVPPDTLPPNARPPDGSQPMRPLTSHAQHAQETHRVRPQMSGARTLKNEPWFIGLVFMIALGIGLGATLLIGSL